MSLSVIHLSDIHIEDSSDSILQRVDALKAACVSSLPSNGTVIIAISGDIANRGKASQYDLAKKMVDTLIEYIIKQKQSKVFVVCVPGNHDCNLTDESSVRQALIKGVLSNEIDENYYNSVVEVQKEYQSFAESFRIDFNSIPPKMVIKTKESSILFLLINTAWMSELHEQQGTIIVPSDLFEEIAPEDYTVVFYVFHHPISWLNPDKKRKFLDNIRQNADLVLVGHEHIRDDYCISSDSFSVYCSHGKELQNRENFDSAFSVLNFDNDYKSFKIIDFFWDGEKYNRQNEKTEIFKKNIASKKRVCIPNEVTIQEANEIGFEIKHFAKENVTLSDVYVWPELSKSDYWNEKNKSIKIKTKIKEELKNDTLTILVGNSSCGKTAFANELFLSEESSNICCLLFNGTEFTPEEDIQTIIEKKYIKQYSQELIEDFRQLPKDQRSVIVDDFDLIKNAKNYRAKLLDYLSQYFGKVTIFLSASIEITTILKSQCLIGQNTLFYYSIMPLGNAKRKEMISKWYNLNQLSLTDEEIDEKVDNAIAVIDTFLGNGGGFIQADPFIIISALQNMDGIKESYTGSKYCHMYDMLIHNSMTKVGDEYEKKGNANIDEGILSEISFKMLQNRQTSFSKSQLQTIISEIEKKQLVKVSSEDFLKRILAAKLVSYESDSSEAYKFKYPYIFYYFCGNYLVKNYSNPEVKKVVEYMSTKLHIRTYGNIIIFLCHITSNRDIVDNILINAYDTLKDYNEFDFDKTNPIFMDIREAVDALIPQRIASSDEDISTNKDKRLVRMDDAGINDGKIIENEDTIHDELSDDEKEKDMASVVAALKTVEVLGEILQNYPLSIDGVQKVEIIDEIHKLGMRAVQAIIRTIRSYENDFVDFAYNRVSRHNHTITKTEITQEAHRFINLLVSGTARTMIHQVATSLNSEHLLLAAETSLEKDKSISSRLVLLDLKLNCLKKCDYNEIQILKKQLDDNKEEFASRIVDSIVGAYLNYNKCFYKTRAKLCTLCGYSQQNTLISSSQNLLDQ